MANNRVRGVSSGVWTKYQDRHQPFLKGSTRERIQNPIKTLQRTASRQASTIKWTPETLTEDYDGIGPLAVEMAVHSILYSRFWFVRDP